VSSSADDRGARRRDALVLGVDLGGTKVRAAIAETSGAVVAEAVEPAAGGDVEAVVAQVVALRDTLAARSGHGPADIAIAGMSLPVALHPTMGLAWSTGNIPGLRGIAPDEVFARALGVPVAADNDGNCATLGEGRAGAAVGETDYAVLAIGTGIGGGIVSGGRLLRGARGGAAELAFLPLGDDPWTARSRELGAFELAVAGPAIVARLGEALGVGEASPLAAGSRLEAIATAAAAGDALAIRLLDDEARLVALGIAAVQAIVDPALVVLSGGVGAVSGLLAPVVRYVSALCAQPPRVVTGRLGERAPLVGALLLANDAGVR
jgi:predicted NBD/HSP70 family sugar kinase